MATLRQRETLAAYGFLAPAYFIYLLFLAIPMVASLLLSVLEVDRLTLATQFVGWANFDWVLTDPRFWKTFGNTFYFIALAVVGNVGLGLGLAVLLDRNIPGPLLYLFRLAYFLPVLVSLAFVSFIWRFMFSFDLGAINYYIRMLGLPPVGWLTDKNVAMFSIVIIDVWKNVGFFVIILLAALQGVPRNLMEAARIDGASPFTALRRIKLPYIAPVILFCVTYATIGGLQVFDSIKIITDGGPGDSTRSVVMYMFSEAFSAGELGTGAASALTLLVVIAIVTAIQLTLGRRFAGR
ncbi:MAG TPA: sugar ABC transporter permease [Devosia sp.]|jgi:multiple sugar transport system permease protein|uniref:carbohydrate ABC transporter permease n=1 Tax=Devosia sp. TaxID=1871048 RepID=UPI002DDC9317|nr:sugar ABC transporter permease [Devosia sp.]HEV2517054.1 sugar ABC transporter permease [Devosia sp.]